MVFKRAEVLDNSSVPDEHTETPGPILTAHLFPKIEALLIELLRSLTPDEWERQTISPKWNVKDVAAHLLDTQLRKLSIVRDGYATEGPASGSPADIVAFVNRLNVEGVALYRKLSARALISLMEVASRESAAYHQSLDPFGQAVFGVSWAGEDRSYNWFDTAREFTERWHHQQQIRLAVNRPGIMTRELYHPVLDCFLRALPYSYRNVDAPPETLLQFDIRGECGGTWRLVREKNSWKLVGAVSGQPRTFVTIPQEIAWRVFTKGIDSNSAVAQSQVMGDRELAMHFFHTTAIVG